jgi:hypothetical protein
MLKADPVPIRTRHEGKIRVIPGKIRMLPMHMKSPGAKATKKTAENTPGKKPGKNNAALQRNLGEKKAMAPAAGLVCRVKFPCSLKMTR